jgi:hypothetical protein
MKAAMKARWYVWIFCFYLGSALHTILRRSSSAPLPHLDPSFFTFFQRIFAPLFCVWIVLWLARATTSWIERTFLILNAIVFGLDVASALHRLGYFSHYISPQLSRWTFFFATVLLGYRTDQILKNQDERIETITCSTPS